MKVGRCAGGACTASAAVLTPVSTIRLGRPAALAPAMSVSSRSPTTSGLVKVPRASASSISAGAGLPATRGSRAGGGLQCGDHGPVAGQQSPFGGQRQVEVGRHPQRSGPDRQRGLRQLSPADGHRQALNDSHRALGEQPHRGQPDAGDLGGQGVGADDEHRGVRRQALGEQPGRTLGTGHHIGGGGGETQFGQMRGDLVCGPRRVIGDEQGPRPGGGKCLHRTRGGRVAAEHGSIEVEQQTIMLGGKACHAAPVT